VDSVILFFKGNLQKQAKSVVENQENRGR
jgi:hypothetical protein